MAVAIIEDSEGQHVLRKPWTVVEHGVTPEEFEARVREDWRCDYIDGVLYMHSPASRRHEDLFGFLHWMLHGYVEERGLGEVLGSRTLIRFDAQRRCEPDILYLPTRLAAKYAGVELFEVPPFIIEITSPSSRSRDFAEKRNVYAEAGVGEYWIVDEENRPLHIDAPAGKETERLTTGVAKSTQLNGFWLDVDWLWQNPLPAARVCLDKVLAGPAA